MNDKKCFTKEEFHKAFYPQDKAEESPAEIGRRIGRETVKEALSKVHWQPRTDIEAT